VSVKFADGTTASVPVTNNGFYESFAQKPTVVAVK